MFRSIIQNSPLAVLVICETGNIVFANAEADRLFDRTGSGIAGTAVSDHVPGAFMLGGKLLLNCFRSNFGNGLIAVTTADGATHHLEVRQSEFTEDDGRLCNILTLADVTQRVLARKALREQEKRWELALRGSEIGVFESDLSTGKGVATDTWFSLLGFEQADGIDSDKLWNERVHPDDRQMVVNKDQACCDGLTERSDTKYRILHKDGTWRWMHSVLLVKERDASGKAVRLLGTMSDITPLRNATELARTREIELRSLIQNAPVPMAVLSRDGTFLILNDSCRTFLGYSRSTALEGHKLWDLGNAEMLGELRSELDDLLSGKAETYVAEKTYQRPGGASVEFIIRISRLGAPTRGEERLIAQMVDITDMNRLSRLKDDFISTVSHELRTPLAAVSGALDLVRARFSEDLAQQPIKLLEMAGRNTHRLRTLVDELLDFQQMNSGELSLHVERTDIIQIVEEAIYEVQPFAERFNVNFDLSHKNHDIVASTDPGRLRQVVSNLLSNAAKFSHEGETVLISVKSENTRCILAVTDKGRGISPEFRDRVFQPFSQQAAHATRDREGSGLGLAICKRLVTRMNGEIGYESVENEGTTFWINIPLSVA